MSVLTPAPTMPAEAVRLLPSFEVDRLVDDVRALQRVAWRPQRPYDADVLAPTDIDWNCIALRSLGGDGGRTDPGGPGSQEFADTPWLDRVPYLRSVLEKVPAPLRAVRLMALGPGARSVVHCDTKCGPAWGVARLHVPVVTNPGALLILDGVEHRWQPGSFWFGDFSRMHQVVNTGAAARVHLVIDCLVVPELAALFPADWVPYFERGDVLHGRRAPAGDTAAPHRFACRFELPEAFADWEEDDVFERVRPWVTGTVDPVGDGLELAVSAGRRLRLVPVGPTEFRFAGWSEERTVQFDDDAADPAVTLRTRVGRTVRELRVPARSPEGRP